MKKERLLEDLKSLGKTLRGVLTCPECSGECFEGADDLDSIIEGADSVEEFLVECERRRTYCRSLDLLNDSLDKAAASAFAQELSMGAFLEMCVDSYLGAQYPQEDRPPPGENPNLN